MQSVALVTIRETLAWLLGRRFRFLIQGHSMVPTLQPNDLVLARRVRSITQIHVGDIAVCTIGDAQYVKRIASINDLAITVLGDNTTDSKDSRTFGDITMGDIIGIVTCKI